jgi:hypothetical protein
MSREQLLRIVEASLPYFAAEDATESRLEAQLMAEGIAPELARQLVVFVPAAFGRVLLRRFRPHFPDTFLLMTAEDGTYKRLFLADEPVFSTALTLAETLTDANAWTPGHQTVADWSAEIQVANSLRQKGNSLADIWFTEAVITSDIGPRGSSVHPMPIYPARQRTPGGLGAPPALKPPERPRPRRPWWRFW